MYLETMFLLKILLQTNTMILMVIQSSENYSNIIYHHKSLSLCLVLKKHKRKKKNAKTNDFFKFGCHVENTKEIKHVEP